MQHRAGRRPFGGDLALAGDQCQRQRFDALDGITRRAPQAVTALGQRLGAGSDIFIGEIARQRIEDTEAKIERQRAM